MAMIPREIEVGRVKVDVDFNMKLSGALDEVTGKLTLVADALAGKLVEKKFSADLRAPVSPEVYEHVERAREQLAGKTLDLDQARTDLADARAQLGEAESEKANLRSKVEGLEGQLHVDQQLIEGLREQIARLQKESSAPAQEQVRPPVPADGAGVEDVFSRASSPQEEAHGAEAERRTDRPLSEPRKPGRSALAEPAAGSDHHLRAGGGAEQPGGCGPLRLRPERDDLGGVRPLQRDAEGRALELAAEGLSGKLEKPAGEASAVQSSEDPAQSPADRIPAGTGDTFLDAPKPVETVVGAPGEQAVPAIAQAAPPESQPSGMVTGTSSAEGRPPAPADGAKFGNGPIESMLPVLIEARRRGIDLSNEKKEPTAQAAQTGVEHPTSDSLEPSADEKAAIPNEEQSPSLSEASAAPPASRLPDQLDEVNTLLREGERAAEAGQRSAASAEQIVAKAEADLGGPRWVRMKDHGSPFHLWPSLDHDQALCGEGTESGPIGRHAFIIVPEGERPNPEAACLDCADAIGWEDPTKKSRPTVKEEPEAQRELALDAPLTAERKKYLSDLAHRANVNGGFALEKKQSRKQPAAPERCLAPGCPNEGKGKRADCVCDVHQVVEQSIRAEWLVARHPELRPKKAKPLGTKKKAKEAANG